jgi:CheY-like chemotaxis protein/two-component sensor histidine kinase
MGMATLLQHSSLAPEQKEYVDIISESTKLLLGILNTFLDFSKLEIGKLELEKRPFSFLRSVSKLVNLFKATASKQKNIVVNFQQKTHLPIRVTGDKYRLKQLLINILSNAVKFTEPGGRVDVSVEQLNINDEQSRYHLIRFIVSDTGIGIPRDKIDKLFKPFSQVDSSMTRKYGGTGLGLSLCKQLTILMGGDITVESQEGKGTSFTFTVILDKPTDATEEKHDSFSKDKWNVTDIPSAVKSKWNVLIVEDNDINQKVITSLMQEMGFSNLTMVGNGKDALAKIQATPYDVILCDVQLPEISGIELMQQIRNMSNMKRPYLVALTACSQNDIREQCKEAGCDYFLSKPFKLQDLKTALARCHKQNDKTS